jgi:hypothetical protein
MSDAAGTGLSAGQQQPVLRCVLRPSYLPSQNRQFVPQHENLEFLRTIAAPE